MLRSLAVNRLNEVRLGRRRLFQKLCNSPCEWTVHGTAGGGPGRERTGQISEAKTWRGDQLGWAWSRGKKAKMMPWLLTWEDICLQAKPSVSFLDSDLLILVTAALPPEESCPWLQEQKSRDGRQPLWEGKHHRPVPPLVRATFSSHSRDPFYGAHFNSVHKWLGQHIVIMGPGYNALQKIRAMCNDRFSRVMRRQWCKAKVFVVTRCSLNSSSSTVYGW